MWFSDEEISVIEKLTNEGSIINIEFDGFHGSISISNIDYILYNED